MTRGTGGLSAAAQRRARVIVVDAIERRGEAVEIALTADLAVGDDVEPGFFLAANGDQGGVTLGFLEQRLRDAPKLLARTRGTP